MIWIDTDLEHNGSNTDIEINGVCDICKQKRNQKLYIYHAKEHKRVCSKECADKLEKEYTLCGCGG